MSTIFESGDLVVSVDDVGSVWLSTKKQAHLRVEVMAQTLQDGAPGIAIDCHHGFARVEQEGIVHIQA